MHQRGINPYQPVEVAATNFADDLPNEVCFRLNHAHLRHGEAQYLLHWHPGRLLFGSLIMIAVCCAIFWWTLQFGSAVFVVGLIAAMIASSLIYLALVHHSKIRIRGRLQDHGLVDGATCTLLSDDQRLVLTTPGGQFQWPNETLKVYRTRRGLLLCPEPLLFVFVPKRNESSPAAYKALRQNLRRGFAS